MSSSQNGWSVVSQEGTFDWHIPNSSRHITLRKGPAGFVLTHFALWFHERIEPIDLGQIDDWGWAVRRISGSSIYSNHASGTAEDLNALKHPSGRRNTFTLTQRLLIKTRLMLMGGVLRWGGSFSTTVDEMHWEINKGPVAVNKLARRLAKTPRGRRVLNLNKHGWTLRFD